MKKLVIVFSVLVTVSTIALGQKYSTRTGKIVFDATTSSSPEKIKAVNNEVASILEADKGHIVFSLAVKNFKFEKPLMEEHFNENYMESEKFPKSTFDATITNLSEVNFKKDGTYTAKASGKLTIHGETKDANFTGTVTVAGGKIKISAKFTATLADYKITIPSVVGDKVAKISNCTIDAEYAQK